MAIYLDSANLNEIEEADRLGLISGVTTNPNILANADLSPAEFFTKLSSTNLNSIFYQATGDNTSGILTEVSEVREILGTKLVLKLPATPLGFESIRLFPDTPCCITAVFSLSQALLAREANAKFVAPYVNRATRLIGDGVQLVRDLSVILQNSSTQILAAGLKSREEADQIILTGATNITVTFALLQALQYHEASDEAVKDFERNGIGI